MQELENDILELILHKRSKRVIIMPSKSLDAFLILKSESVIYSLNLDQSKFVFTILLACSCRDVVGFWGFFF